MPTCVFMSSNPRFKFRFGTTDGAGERQFFRGEFLTFGDTALLRKLPTLLCGDTKPIISGKGP